MTRAWVLNFDADEELARPDGYTPRPAVQARFAALLARVGPLVPAGDVMLLEGTAHGSPGHTAPEQGRAFCPTPRALRVLRAAGVEAPLAPPLDVLRRVNDRAWSAALGLLLPGAAVARDLAAIASSLSSPSPTGAWLLKRAFAFAGRGALVATPGPLSAHVQGWATAALAVGGVEIAPLCDRVADFGLHGFLAEDGALCLGEPTSQHIDDRGTWIDSVRSAPSDLTNGERTALEGEARRVASALHDAGYFGPFGIDAFRWRDARGELQFNPRCEVNARYSMGWATGMGERRPDLG